MSQTASESLILLERCARRYLDQLAKEHPEAAQCFYPQVVSSVATIKEALSKAAENGRPHLDPKHARLQVDTPAPEGNDADG